MAKKFTKTFFDGLDIKIDGAEIAWELMQDLRPHDKEDMLAVDNDIAFEIIKSMRLSDECYVYRGEDGKLLCVCGVGLPPADGIGRAFWMLGTNELYNGYVRPVLMKEARKMVDEWLDKYGLLHNLVYEKNEPSIRYMNWLGARWLPMPFVHRGKIFKQFFIMGKGVQ